MSVVGIDFGNSTMVVGAARHRGIDIIANEASRRETPALVGFKDNRRYLGEAAATQVCIYFTQKFFAHQKVTSYLLSQL